MWTAFREHHYLNTEKLGAGIRCYVAKYNDMPIAFCAVACVHMKSYYYRISRLVVLPDYQGIGVGKRLMTFMAQYYTQQRDMPFYILTTNPQIIHGNLSDWTLKRIGHVIGGTNDSRINRGIRSSLSKNRLTATLQYTPQRRNAL